LGIAAALQLRIRPVFPAIGAHLDASDASAAAPGKSADRPPPGLVELQGRGGRGDDGLGIHLEAELARLSTRQRVGVLGGLVTRHVRLVDELETPKPLHARISLPPGQQQSHGIAVLHPKWFAVLSPDEQCVVETLRDRDAARQHRGIAALGQKPRRLRLEPRLAEEE
jgi:hypothetical protein